MLLDTKIEEVLKKKTDCDVNIVWDFYVVLPLYLKFFSSLFS